MLDIQKEKAFIQEIDKRTRELELEKVRLEQNKVLVEEQIKQIVDKMEKLNCTPDTIKQKIEEHTVKIEALKAKMESMLKFTTV